MQVINNITMLAVILTGAALIREHEQGTVEHLLIVMATRAENAAGGCDVEGFPKSSDSNGISWHSEAV
jgi:hypothetical protein